MCYFIIIILQKKIQSLCLLKRLSLIYFTRSVNARFAGRIVGQSNFSCLFQIDQSQSLDVTISSPSLFCIGNIFNKVRKDMI